MTRRRGYDPGETGRLDGVVIDRLDTADEIRDQATGQWERDLRSTTDHLRQLLDERLGA